MKTFESNDQKELEKILEFILSKDIEIVKCGIIMLRSSKVYRKLRPLSLFYYPYNSHTKIRTSTFINQRIKVIINSEIRLLKEIARKELKVMFLQLLSNKVRSYFRREFINTASIL